MFQPHFEILPPSQQALWPALAEIPQHFVLYDGTALPCGLGAGSPLTLTFSRPKRSPG